MISRSWKKFLSSCKGVAALGTVARLANTYAAPCTRTGARAASRRRQRSLGGPGLERLELHGQEFSGRKAVLGSRARGPAQACAEEQVSTVTCTTLPLQPPCWVSRWVPVACLRPSSPAEQTQPGRGGCRWLGRSSAGTRLGKSRLGQRVCIFHPG